MLQSALASMYTPSLGGVRVRPPQPQTRVAPAPANNPRVKPQPPQPPQPVYHQQPQPQDAAAAPNFATSTQDTIFVSIPAYRDPEVITTLEELFKKAKYPQRVIAGVCQQIDELKDHAFDVRATTSNVLRRYMDQNIRILTLPASEAKGPSYARARIEQDLFEDEIFFLGIDSHTAFVPGWDVLVIDELLKCNSARPMLTVYPQDYTRKAATGGAAGAGNKLGGAAPIPTANRTVNTKSPVCFIKFNSFHPQLGLPQTERVNFRKPPRQPQPSLFISAGFVFTLGEVIREAPYEELPYLFLGEEIVMALKYFLTGVDFFSPSKHIVFHLNDRTYRPLFWENFYQSSNGRRTTVPEHVRSERKAIERASQEYVLALLTGNATFRFGGGDNGHNGSVVNPTRTVDQFRAYTGLDVVMKTATREALMGLVPGATREEVVCKTGQ